jgi:hypothetical protein
MEEIINKVAQSNLVSLDLEDYYHTGERVIFDLKPYLFQELILKEKDFRAALKAIDFSQFTGKNVAVCCTADAIVPTWAYMLLATYLAPYANMFVFGDTQALEDALFRDALQRIDYSQYENAKVVVKGCSKHPVPTSAYVEITRRLQPIVSSLMFGEPCSTVPLYKQKTAKQ